MPFTATLEASGSLFNEVLVIVTQATLIYRLNDQEGEAVENWFRLQYKVYVPQGDIDIDVDRESLQDEWYYWWYEWEQLKVNETINIIGGNVLDLAETKLKALSKFSDIV